MSWSAILVMAAGAYAFKAIGLLVLGGRTVAGRMQPLVGLLPAALFSALIVQQTLVSDGELVIDARLAGVLAGAIAVWRRAPFVVVVLVAMAVTALVRAAA
jgi:branched-subunit amino acid transport protein